MKSAERMRAITQQVERSTEEQNRGGQQVTQAVENIRESIEKLSQAQEGQLKSHLAMQQCLSSLNDANKRARGVFVSLERSVADAAHQLDPLVLQLKT